MRAAIKQTDVYTFDELEEEAQETAINNFREYNLDYEWWDCTFEDATQIGKIMGIEVDKIFFSGFSSQGDGACFEGSYEYAKQSVKTIKEYAPLDTELHQIALGLSRIQRRHFYQLTANVKQQGHYMHAWCTSINVYGDSDFTDFYVDVETEDTVTELLRDFMQWIYRHLELQYDFLQSDEIIIESIKANLYEYTENGEMY